jgi:hypothetical protein
MTYQDLLELSMRRFWYLNKQVDRLRAEEALWQMRILASVTTPESFEKESERFSSAVGEIAVFAPVTQHLVMDDPNAPDPEFDRAAFESLRQKLLEGR